jgi:hypothetical protein
MTIRLIVMELGKFIVFPRYFAFFRSAQAAKKCFAEKMLKSYNVLLPTSSNPITTITVFTRHAPTCPKNGAPQWKRCNCRKSLYIHENGHRRYVSAKTRSWEKAEEFAEQERKARDPIEIQLREIAEQEAAREAEREAAREAKNMTIEEALARWTAGMKKQSAPTQDAYQTFVRKMLKWEELQNLAYLRDVPPAMLDEWRSACVRYRRVVFVPAIACALVSMDFLFQERLLLPCNQ